MLFTIEKAKLKKGADSIDFSFIKLDEDGTRKAGSENVTAPIHTDLKLAFESLAIHLAVMVYFVKPGQIKDIANVKPDLFEGFNVTSFSLGGDDGKEGVTLSGTRILSNGKAFNFNTPFYRFEEDEKTRYTFMDDLQEKLERLDEELHAYYAGTKRGAAAQLEMFDAPPITNLQIAAPEKPISNDTNGLHDVTEEYIEFNENRKAAQKIPKADPDAMARVAAADHEEAEVLEETTNKPAPPAKKGGRKKRVAQSAEAPGGQIEDVADDQ